MLGDGIHILQSILCRVERLEGFELDGTTKPLQVGDGSLHLQNCIVVVNVAAAIGVMSGHGGGEDNDNDNGVDNNGDDEEG